MSIVPQESFASHAVSLAASVATARRVTRLTDPHPYPTTPDCALAIIRRADEPADDIAPADEPDPVGPSFADQLWVATNSPSWDAPAPAEPRLPFADAIEIEASRYRLLDTPFGNWLAAKLDGLAEDARFFEASCPTEFDARQDAHNDWLALASEGGIR